MRRTSCNRQRTALRRTQCDGRGRAVRHCNRRHFTLQQAVVVWDDGTTVTANDATVDRSSGGSATLAAARQAPSARSSPCRRRVVAALLRRCIVCVRRLGVSAALRAWHAMRYASGARASARTPALAHRCTQTLTLTHTHTHTRTHAHKHKHARTQMQARTHAACDVLAVLTCSR